MHIDRVKFRTPFLTLLLSLGLIGLWLAAPANGVLFDQLVLDQGKALQLWRLVSGHALHTSFTHLAWNLAAFALLGAAIELESRARLARCLLVGCGAVSIWFFCQDDFTRYAGASGMLNTLLIAALYSQRQRLSNKVALLIALGALIKVIIETLTSTSLTSEVGSDAAWPSATGAHAAGYAAGIALALIWAVRTAGTDDPSAPN